MNSMTGYGRATAALGSHALAVRISSVNRKTLDLSVGLPRDWEELEPAVTTAVRGAVIRGKVHVAIDLTGGPAAAEVEWDDDGVARMLARLQALAAKQGVPFAATTDLLWRMVGAERREASLPAPETAQPVVLAALQEALRGFLAMRATEGAALQADLLARVALLGRQVAAVTARAPQVTAAYRDQLLRRLREAGLELDPADERVLKEIALFADRCDISEELTRLRSHLEQLDRLMRADGEIGRKAEFILQEISRESHTIGSKANDLEIARAVIEFKNELERVREQIANVE